MNVELLTQQAARKPYSPIRDLLSENPAHPAFCENRDKTGNWHIDV